MEQFKGLANLLKFNKLFNFDTISYFVKKYRNHFLLLVFITLVLTTYLITNLIGPASYNTLIFIFGPVLLLFFLQKGIESILPLFVLICYINYFIYYFKLPEFLMWYVELCAIALFFKVGHVLTSQKGLLMKPYFLLIISAIVVHFVSFLLNAIPLEQLFTSLRRYFVYYAIFIAIIVLSPKKKFYEILIKVLIFTVFIQIPISIVQYFIFVRADFMGGLFGKNSAATMATLGIGFVFLGYYLYRHYKRKKLFLVAGIGMIIPLFLSESKICMLFLPVVYIYHLVMGERKKLIKGLLIMLSLIPFYVGMMYSFDIMHSRNYMKNSLRDPLFMFKLLSRDMETVDERMKDFGGEQWRMFNRAESIPVAFNLIKDSPRKLLFGYGPGEGSRSLYAPGSLLHYGFFPTFLVIVLLELGIIGMLVWLMAFIYLYAINIKCLRYFMRIKSKSLWKAFIFFSNIQMFVFIVDFAYSRSFLLPYKALFFWITNGLVVWYYYKYIINRRGLLIINNESQEN